MIMLIRGCYCRYDQGGKSAVQSSTSSANSRAVKGGGSKDEESKRHEIVTIALLPAGLSAPLQQTCHSSHEPISPCFRTCVLHLQQKCLINIKAAAAPWPVYSTECQLQVFVMVVCAGVHEAFRASARPTNSKPMQPSHDSASSLHQTQVNQNTSVSRLNPANLRAIEESSALTSNPSRTSSIGQHARRILRAAHLSSSAPSQRAQSNASASSTDTAAHTTASSLFSSVHSPVNNPAAAAVRKLAAGLKATLQELFGTTLHLSASTVAMTFPTAFDRLHVSFYRSKITSWMAAQEEDYRQDMLFHLCNMVLYVL